MASHDKYVTAFLKPPFTDIIESDMMNNVLKLFYIQQDMYRT